jgi:hypothetical protein
MEGIRRGLTWITGVWLAEHRVTQKSHSDFWLNWLEKCFNILRCLADVYKLSPPKILTWCITTCAVHMLHEVSNGSDGQCTPYYCRKHMHRNINEKSPFEKLTDTQSRTSLPLIRIIHECARKSLTRWPIVKQMNLTYTITPYFH